MGYNAAMSGLSYRTAGESHGASLLALVEGLPAGLTVRSDVIDRELQRRQGGYGRGARQQLEQDRVSFLSGVRNLVTIGSPIAMQIPNRDQRLDSAPPVHRPRPGHADLAGSLKRLTTDCRETLERASARETAARTAAGALVKSLLGEFGIECLGFVVRIGAVAATIGEQLSATELASGRDANEVYCPDAGAAAGMIEQIRQRRGGGAGLRLPAGIGRLHALAGQAGRAADAGGRLGAGGQGGGNRARLRYLGRLRNCRARFDFV